MLVFVGGGVSVCDEEGEGGEDEHESCNGEGMQWGSGLVGVVGQSAP